MHPAVQAAVEVGEAHGLEVSDPVLLHETNNTVVWLRPAPVVAKVATRADAVDPLHREHAIAVELAADGADTAAPRAGAAPEQHAATGLLVSLWELLEAVDGEVPDSTLATSLAALHTALARTTTSLPSFWSALLRARTALDDDAFMAPLPVPDRSFLRSVYDAGLDALDGLDVARRRLHGEPHSGNRLLTAHGLRWLDFESCCVGPLEWDLAFQSAGVVAAFPDVDVELLRRLRRLNSARVATWCWGGSNVPDMRLHGEHHLALLRDADDRP